MIRLKSVVFPAPFGPISPTASPAGRSGELLADERLHRVYMGLQGGPGSR